MATKIPEFKGYTVDIRLKQFRKVNPEKNSIEFIDFDCEEGDALLGEYIDALDLDKPEDRKIMNAILR